MSNALSKKTIVEILIKNKCPLKEISRRNFEFSWYKHSFKEKYQKNVEFLCVKHPFKENY